MTSDPRLAAIVLNYNNYVDTACCIHSLKREDYGNLDIILVDNCSTDDSGRRLESEFEAITVIHTPENLGFAGGMNQGIKAAIGRGADYICLMNNDVVLDSGVFRPLIETIERRPDLGLLSPKILTPEGDTWFERGQIDWASGMANHGIPGSNDSTLVDNDYVPFCVAVFRREVFDDIGLLNEEYFMYFSDADFCTKVKDAGYDILTRTDVSVEHHVSRSSGGPDSPLPTYYITRNRWLFYKNFPDRVERFYKNYLIWMLNQLKTDAKFRRYRLLLAHIRGAVDGVRGKQGRGPYP